MMWGLLFSGLIYFSTPDPSVAIEGIILPSSNEERYLKTNKETIYRSLFDEGTKSVIITDHYIFCSSIS